MRYRTEIRVRKIPHSSDGVHTEMIDETYEHREPLAPRDWDAISTRVGFSLVGVLTLISITWSTWSIGSLLGGGVGFLAALLFDISWAVCLLLEWKARFDSNKRSFPRVLGWILLLVTMGFIGWHGFVQDNVPLAVVGASVSAFAKVLWLGIMKHVDRNLNDADRQWVEAQISKANARLAVAEVRRQVARVEAQAVGYQLAIDAARPDTTDVVVRTLPDATGQQSGQSDPQPADSVPTGSDTSSGQPDRPVPYIPAVSGATATVRALSGAGVPFDQMAAVIAAMGIEMKPETLSRAIRREASKSEHA